MRCARWVKYKHILCDVWVTILAHLEHLAIFMANYQFQTIFHRWSSNSTRKSFCEMWGLQFLHIVWHLVNFHKFIFFLWFTLQTYTNKIFELDNHHQYIKWSIFKNINYCSSHIGWIWEVMVFSYQLFIVFESTGIVDRTPT